MPESYPLPLKTFFGRQSFPLGGISGRDPQSREKIHAQGRGERVNAPRHPEGHHPSKISGDLGRIDILKPTLPSTKEQQVEHKAKGHQEGSQENPVPPCHIHIGVIGAFILASEAA